MSSDIIECFTILESILNRDNLDNGHFILIGDININIVGMYFINNDYHDKLSE